MVLFEGPAVLRGIIMSVALGAWALGRWQSGFAVTPDGGVAEPACAGAVGLRETPARCVSPSPSTAPPEHHSTFDHAASLGELHAEVSAYRRAQQVLATLESDPLPMMVLAGAERADCRYVGLIGQPTCAMPQGARAASGCGSGCAGYTPRVTAQPSAPASALTRV